MKQSNYSAANIVQRSGQWTDLNPAELAEGKTGRGQENGAPSLHLQINHNAPLLFNDSIKMSDSHLRFIFLNLTTDSDGWLCLVLGFLRKVVHRDMTSAHVVHLSPSLRQWILMSHSLSITCPSWAIHERDICPADWSNMELHRTQICYYV